MPQSLTQTLLAREQKVMTEDLDPAGVSPPGAFRLSGVISPTALAAATHNWNPTSLSTSSVIRVTLTGAQNLTGIAGGASGRILVLHNVDTVDNLTLKDEDAGSTAANRFAMPGDVVLVPDASAVLQYDSTSSRWRCIYTGNFSAGGDLAGTFPNPTVAKSSTAFALTGDISPAALAAQADDYNPANLATSSTIRIDLTGSQTLSSVAGGADGRILIVHNIDAGADVLTIINDDGATGTAANRFYLPSNMALKPKEGAIFQYDSTASRWRCIGVTRDTTAGGDLTGTYPSPTIGANKVTNSKIDVALIQTAVVDIATADVKLLFGTPYALVAGVAGKVCEFLGATLVLNYATITYDTNGILEVTEETTGTVLSTDLAAASFLFSGADKISTLKPITTDVARTNGKGLQLRCTVGNPATGNSPVRVIVAYRLHDTGL